MIEDSHNLAVPVQQAGEWLDAVVRVADVMLRIAAHNRELMQKRSDKDFVDALRGYETKPTLVELIETTADKSRDLSRKLVAAANELDATAEIVNRRVRRIAGTPTAPDAEASDGRTH